MARDSAGFQLQLVPLERKEDFRQVFQTYLHNLAQYYGDEPVDGQYPYRFFDAYWEEPDSRWLYGLYDLQDEIAGFAMVRVLEGGLYEIAEFGVVDGFQRQGVGSLLLKEILRKYVGGWRLEYAAKNVRAGKFWQYHFGKCDDCKQRLLEEGGVSKVELSFKTTESI